jgi:hypothetical protein
LLRDVAWREPGQAGILVAMDVEQANSHPEFQELESESSELFLHSLLEVNPVLTHDVIHDQSNWNVIHVVGESLAYAVVHIKLPEDGDEISSRIRCSGAMDIPLPLLEIYHRGGMKNPWQQAVAPIPVTSRCALLEFACSMAL